MTKIIYSSAIMSLFVVIAILIVVMHNYMEKSKNCQTVFHNHKTILNMFEHQGNTRYLSLKDVVIKDENNLTSDFHELFGQPKLLIRIADVGCLSCISSFMENLPKTNQMIDSIGVKNACFILPDILPREIVKFKKDNNIQSKVISIPTGKIPVPMENTEYIIPCYFLLINDNNTIIDCFIPINDLPSLQDLYFKSLIRFFK